MEEMTFPILINAPSAPRLPAKDWMKANDAMCLLIPLALREKTVKESAPVPVRFTLTDDDQDQKTA